MDSRAAWQEYHRLRIAQAVEGFSRRSFTAHSFEAAADAVEFFFSSLSPHQSVGYGGSDTIRQLGLLDRLRGGEYDFLDRSRFGHSYDEQLSVRRESLSADVFIASANAVSIDGALVNIDGVGNRVAGLSFGPAHVFLFIGRNKLCDDLDAAIYRARNTASVALAIRLKRKTPCVKTGTCHNCSSPDRICNSLSIIERSEPAGRISLLFINEDLGL